MGLASGLSLANHFAWPTHGLAQGPSWWLSSFSQDGFQRQGSWEVGQLLPPGGPSQILPVSLQGSTSSGPPAVSQLLQRSCSFSQWSPNKRTPSPPGNKAHFEGEEIGVGSSPAWPAHRLVLLQLLTFKHGFKHMISA